MKRNYLFIFLTLLFITLLFSNCESGSEKKKKNNNTSSSISAGYDIKNLKESDYLEPAWSQDKTIFITVFKYTVNKNSNDWAMIFLYGVTILYKKVTSMDKILAIGIIYNDGKQKGYYILAKDVRDFANGTITSDQFVERIFTKDF